MKTYIEAGPASAQLLRPLPPLRSSAPARFIAVSGGMGSGKSTFASALASQGATVADADRIAREILAPHSPALAEVAQRFGEDLILRDGSVDRAALASRVFSGEDAEEKIADLNAITHPRIAERAWQILRSTPDGRIAVYDIPLLIEGESSANFDVIIMVDAPMEQRLQRLEERGVPREEAHKRIAAQASNEERRAIAHLWVTNAGSAADLSRLAEAVYRCWLLPTSSHAH